MSRHGPAAHGGAHIKPLRSDPTPSRMGFDGSCYWVWGASVSFNPGVFGAF